MSIRNAIFMLVVGLYVSGVVQGTNQNGAGSSRLEIMGAPITVVCQDGAVLRVASGTNIDVTCRALGHIGFGAVAN